MSLFWLQSSNKAEVALVHLAFINLLFLVTVATLGWIRIYRTRFRMAITKGSFLPSLVHIGQVVKVSEQKLVQLFKVVGVVRDSSAVRRLFTSVVVVQQM